MKPGRELDALVAEKVMGCAVNRRIIGGSDELDLSCDCKMKPHDTGDLYSELKFYSTDISAAWEVVEKLTHTESYMNFRLSKDQEEPNHNFEYYAVFEETEQSYESHGDSAPHAICLAALKAVGVEL